MAEKLRVGVIASGRIARMHGGGWRECDRTEIVAIADNSGAQSTRKIPSDRADVVPSYFHYIAQQDVLRE